MVPEMSVASTPVRACSLAGRIGLLAGYLLLVLLINPIALQHELAEASDAPHADRDFCTWLDHAAGSSVHSSAAMPFVTKCVTPCVLPPAVVSVSRRDHHDPVRGPPVLFS